MNSYFLFVFLFITLAHDRRLVKKLNLLVLGLPKGALSTLDMQPGVWPNEWAFGPQGRNKIQCKTPQPSQTRGQKWPDHGIMVVVCPAKVTVITPAHAHIQVETLLSAGMLPIITVAEPGTHGAVMTGTQGIGVNTPDAAAVAVMTVGFVGALHMPNGIMLTIG